METTYQPTAGAALAAGTNAVESGDLVLAQQNFTRALAEPSQGPAAHYGLGLVATRSGDSQRALEHFSTAFTLDRRFAGAAFQIARLHREQGDIGACARWCATTLRLDHKHVSASHLMTNLEELHPAVVAATRSGPTRSSSAGSTRTRQSAASSAKRKPASGKTHQPASTRFAVPQYDALDDYIGRMEALERRSWYVRKWGGKPWPARIATVIGLVMKLAMACAMVAFLIAAYANTGGSPFG